MEDRGFLAPVDNKGLEKFRDEEVLPIRRVANVGKRNCFMHRDTQGTLPYRDFPWIGSIHRTIRRIRSKDMARETHHFSPVQSELFGSMLRL